MLLDANPGAVYIELVRNALLRDHVPTHHVWGYALFWALFSFVGGFLFFYRGEQGYGRG